MLSTDSHKNALLPGIAAAVQTPRGVARFDGFRYVAADVEKLQAFCQLSGTCRFSGGDLAASLAESFVQDESARYFWAQLVQATATMAGRFAAIR